MTYEEAIKIFKNTSCATQKARQALVFAIEALEKQIPKKPKWIYGKDMGIAKCSVCGKELHYYMNGCPECLNAIDWGDDE